MLAEKFQVLSQREKVLVIVFCVVLLAAGLTYIIPLVMRSGQPAGTSAAIRPPNVTSPAGTAVVPLAPGLRTDIKDPFIIPPVYQVKKEAAAANAAPGTGRTPVSVKPVLSGVISCDKIKMAILELNNNSETLSIGDSIGEYKVMAIADNQVVLDGPEGQVALNLGR